MLIGKYRDYRQFLKDCLELRMQKNTKYSLRAFARDLDIAPQILSSVLLNKKGISTEVATNISTRLNLNEQETNYFCDLVDLAHARSNSSKKIAALRLTRYKEELQFHALKEDTFRVIVDWYHNAILEMTFIEGFKSDPGWIAKRLNISNHEAKQACERLQRLGLIVVKKGQFCKSEKNLTTTHDIPSESIQKFNRQILSKASDALTFQNIDERDFTTMTMAIDVKKIPEAKKRIRAFRHEMMDFLESGRRDEVYCLSLQLFKLTNKNIGET